MSFCSHECLSSSAKMVDKLGPILQSHAEGLSEEKTLAILLLATSTLNAFDHMMTRMSYSTSFLPEKRDDSDAIQLEEIDRCQTQPIPFWDVDSLAAISIK